MNFGQAVLEKHIPRTGDESIASPRADETCGAILGKTKYSPVEDAQGDSEPEWQRTGGFASDGGQFIQSRAAEYKVS